MKSKIKVFFKYILLGIILALVFIPFIYFLILAFCSGNLFLHCKSVFELVKYFTFDNFKNLFVTAGFSTALKNSLFNTLVSVFVSILVGISTSYILSRKHYDFRLKKPLVFWTLLVRVLPPIAFVIPLYTLFNKMGLLPTRMPVILACILINIPLIIWFMMTFFINVPEEIEESARIDGASDFVLFRKIVLPIVLPGIAAVAMLSFIYAWNEYTYSIIFIRSPENYTIPLALSVLNTEDNVTDFGLVSAGGLISFLPICLFVIFAQKYLISGLSGGAVKE